MRPQIFQHNDWHIEFYGPGIMGVCGWNKSNGAIMGDIDGSQITWREDAQLGIVGSGPPILTILPPIDVIKFCDDAWSRLIKLASFE